MSEITDSSKIVDIGSVRTSQTKLRGRKPKDGRTSEERAEFLIKRILDDLRKQRNISFKKYSKEIGIPVETLKKNVVDAIKKAEAANSTRLYKVKKLLLDKDLIRSSRFSERPVKRRRHKADNPRIRVVIKDENQPVQTDPVDDKNANVRQAIKEALLFAKRPAVIENSSSLHNDRLFREDKKNKKIRVDMVDENTQNTEDKIGKPKQKKARLFNNAKRDRIRGLIQQEIKAIESKGTINKNDEITIKALKVADCMIVNKCSTLKAAKILGMKQPTVSVYINKVLPKINEEIFSAVRIVVNQYKRVKGMKYAKTIKENTSLKKVQTTDEKIFQACAEIIEKRGLVEAALEKFNQAGNDVTERREELRKSISALKKELKNNKDLPEL